MFSFELEQRYLDELETRLQPNVFEAVLSTNEVAVKDAEKIRANFSDQNLMYPYDDIDGLIESIYRDFINTIDKCENSIIFVSLVPYFMQYKIAKALKWNGYKPFFISVQPIQASIKQMIHKEFGWVANTGGSYRLLEKLLKKMKPNYCHVQCWMWHYNIGRICIDSLNDTIVACDFYDVTSIYAEPAHLELAFNREKIDMDFYLEGYILREANHIITRYTNQANRNWEKRHGIRKEKTVSFQPYPVSEFTRSRAGKNFNSSDIRIAYAGGLVPTDLDPALFPESYMWNMFREIIDQNINIDVLHDPHREISSITEVDVFKKYKLMEDQSPFFRLKNGFPPDKLCQILSNYHFGILLADFTQVNSIISWDQRTGVFATKLFTYLESGLPIIVNEEYSAMSKFVNRHNIGISINSHEVKFLRDIILSCDYHQMCCNVDSYIQTNCMAIRIHDLIDLIFNSKTGQ